MNLFKTMKLYRTIFTLFLAAFLFGCSTSPNYTTPTNTLEAYAKAVKKNDTAMMKRLLSNATIQMHEQQAQQQNIPVEEIIQRETLINPGQTSLKFRNQKIEGERATIEVENSFGQYDVMPFVLEDGIWKIDKMGYANQLRQDIEQQNDQNIDDVINKGRIP